MTKFFTKLASGAAMLAVVSVSSVAGIAEAAVITGNTSAGENQSGWMFNRDTSTQTAYEFSTGAASVGKGSILVLPIQNNNPKDKFVAENFTFSKIAEVKNISFDFQVVANSVSDARHFYMNVYANFGGSPATKYYDCRYNIAAVNGSMDGFTTVTFSPSDKYSVTTSGSSPHTCPDSPAEMDTSNAEPSIIRMFAINVGDESTEDQGVSGYLDNVVLTLVSGEAQSYDFEPVVVAKNSADKYFTSLQAAIDETSEGVVFLTSDVTVESAVIVNKNITLEGNGNSLVLNGAGTSGTISGLGIGGGAIVQNLKVSGSVNDNLIETLGDATLTNVSVEGGKQAGITVLDNSTLTIGGEISLEGNSWGGINIKSVPTAKLVVAAGSVIEYAPVISGNYTDAPAIYVKGADVVETPANFITDNDKVLTAPVWMNGDRTQSEIPTGEVWWNVAEVVVPTTPTTPSRSSGGGSRAVADRNTTPAGEVAGAQTGPVGEVLGASTVVFTRQLGVGANGTDVSALQSILIASGDLAIAAPTGYFGELTKAALAKWQARNGIPSTGYFGPLTMAAINAATTPAAVLTEAQRAALLKELLEKVTELQKQLEKLQ